MKKKEIVFSTVFLFVLVSTAFTQVHTFVVMGDNRPGFIQEKQPYIFHKLVREILRLRPGAVFSTGDMVLGSEDAAVMNRMADDFKEVIAKFGDIPFYTIPGNHDLHDKDLYVKQFGSTYFSVDRNNCHFIMLSSEEPGELSRIAGAQFEWLLADLEKSRTADHRFVLVHRPMYPKIAHIGDSMDKYPAERDSLAALFRKYSVDMVFAGHTHIYNFSVVDGISQIITGGSGAPLYASSPIDGGFYHFIYVVVNGNDVDYRTVRVEDEIKIADELRRCKEYARSLEFAQKAMDIIPDHPQTYLATAMAYHYLEDQGNFQKMFQKFVGFQGDEEEALFLLGHSFLNIDRDTRAAEKYYTMITAMNPDSEYAFFYLGRVRYQEKKYQEAVDYFKKAGEMSNNQEFKERVARAVESAAKRISR
jgi:tetratricopeptide (TPR) repeat protein